MDEIQMETDIINNVNQEILLAQTTEVSETPPEETGIDGSEPNLFTSKSLLELSNSSWCRSKRARQDIQPYLRGCKWSPDGTCCLSVVNNDGVHVTELSRDLYSGSVGTDRIIDVLDSVIHVKEAGLIYDFCWYPGMNSALPETCCWLTTRQNAPVQMWDAFDGSLRCSYRGFNAVDEMEPALSVMFMPNGSRIVAGYKKYLRTFDVERPGREYSEHNISSPASCLATCDNLLAVGSWNTSISLYNISEMGTYKSIGKMHGHSGGITHMKFAPDGLRLISGARKDHRLLVWDIRYFRTPINILPRVCNTNQRIYFDISPCGKYLVTGGTDGIVKVWDANNVNWKASMDLSEEGSDTATYKFPLHNDCCNSISIHPYRPILATGSGQYHFIDPVSALEEDTKLKSLHNGIQNNDPNNDVSISNDGIVNNDISVNYNNSYNNEDKEQSSVKDIDMKYSTISENSLVFWWIGDMPDLT